MHLPAPQRPEVADKPLTDDELEMVCRHLTILPNYAWGYYPTLASRLLATIDRLKQEYQYVTEENDQDAR